MDWLDLVQWPAMLVTVAASLAGRPRRQRRREIGVWVFLASNALWVAWGLHTQAYALVGLQACLAALNIHGAHKNESDA